MTGRICMADLLEPVLNAAEAGEPELARAVTLVAEAMAVLGITVARANGQALPGISDEKAVLYLLQRYRQALASHSQLEEALALRDLARRIERLERARLP
ncbi:hypothetical protein HHL28_08845 [Aerophototrophica crusticola]|uniref:Uncharacterized protein n=1 Tax=Aerophototrophica crusticola TaxID=1709002 RepID=A0A858R6Y2_9PROT|nr:hypothetical protein HHL28_08845 [Rhodospirillaceae bacterium B3]